MAKRKHVNHLTCWTKVKSSVISRCLQLLTTSELANPPELSAIRISHLPLV